MSQHATHSFWSVWSSLLARVEERRRLVIYKPTSRAQQVFQRFLPAALGASVEKVLGHVGAQSIGAAVALSASATGVAVFASLGGALARAVAEIAQKEKKEQLTASVLTGLTELQQVLAARTRSEGDHAEDERLLHDAADRFQEAKNKRSLSDLYMFITASQALTRALLLDNQKYLGSHLDELRACTKEAESLASTLRARAYSINGIRPYTRIEKHGIDHISPGAWKDEMRKAQLEDEASSLERYANALSELVDVISVVAASRQQMRHLDPEKLLGDNVER